MREADLIRGETWVPRFTYQGFPLVELTTDCPQRDERLGWPGDAQIYLGTAASNADVAAFITKCLDSQSVGRLAQPRFRYLPVHVDAAVTDPPLQREVSAATSGVTGSRASVAIWSILMAGAYTTPPAAVRVAFGPTIR